MAATTDDLCNVFDTDLNEFQLESMLETADTLISTHIDPLSDPRVTVAVRDKIQVWLAAHFASILDPQTKEESADGVRTVFHGKTDMGLNFTPYGQQAMIVDPTGMLKKLEQGTKTLRTHFSSPRSQSGDP